MIYRRACFGRRQHQSLNLVSSGLANYSNQELGIRVDWSDSWANTVKKAVNVFSKLFLPTRVHCLPKYRSNVAFQPATHLPRRQPRRPSSPRLWLSYV